MTEIEEIIWETFDERTRIWMQVLSNIPVEAVVRKLRLDLNTGVVTLRGAGGDRVLGVISTDDDTGVGRSFFVTLKGEPMDPITYESGYARNINLPERVIKIRTGRGTAKVALSTLEGTNLADVDITMGSRGVSYPFCAMTGLINAAVSGGRSEEEDR